MSGIYATTDKLMGSVHSRVFGSARSASLGNMAQSLMGTAISGDLSKDGITWANCPPMADKNGNLIIGVQRNSDGTGTQYNSFMYRNAGGAWADSTLNETGLTRPAIAYDAANNLLNVLWYSTGLPGQGILYRRYKINYSGANITDIVSDNGVTIGGAAARTNLVMENQTGLTYEDPQFALIGNVLMAAWCCQSVTGNEIRATMCDLTAGINRGQTAANWVGINANDAPGVIGGGAPPVAFSKVFSSASTTLPVFGMRRKGSGTHAGDLYFVYCDGASPPTYFTRRAIWNSGAGKWTGGFSLAVTICAIQRAGTDTGYGAHGGGKFELTTAPVESATGDCMYVGIATWKDNTAGDTWGFARIDAADGIALVDTYSAGGPQTLYPTGAIAYEAAKGLLVVSYCQQTTGAAYVQLYNGLSAQGSPVLAYNGSTTDIPTLLDGATLAGKVVILTRDAGAVPAGPYPPTTYSPPPYRGWQATLDWQ